LDAALSRLKQGFNSPRERQRFQCLSSFLGSTRRRFSNFSPKDASASGEGFSHRCLRQGAANILQREARHRSWQTGLFFVELFSDLASHAQEFAGKVANVLCLIRR